MVSVIVVCWKRFVRMREILETWVQEPEVDEILIWDNSGCYSTDLPVTVFNSQENINPSVRYAIASMCKNDAIIHCDDDVLPLTGITSDFLKYFDEGVFLGVEGMDFIGNCYKDQRRCCGNKIYTPRSVEMILGYLTMIHKKHLLGHDYSRYYRCQLEMCLQMDVPYLKKRVVPTRKYQVLKESKDDNALHLSEAARAEHDELYHKWTRRKLME